MSQSKVDKKKYEKKHRKEILRKQKIKKIIAITVTIVVIAAIVGSVAGVKIYKAIPKYVDASGLSEYVDKTWKDSGYDTLFLPQLPMLRTQQTQLKMQKIQQRRQMQRKIQLLTLSKSI